MGSSNSDPIHGMTKASPFGKFLQTLLLNEFAITILLYDIRIYCHYKCESIPLSFLQTMVVVSHQTKVGSSACISYGQLVVLF